MRMHRNVKLSKTAEKKLNSLFEYLLKEWSEKIKSDFIIKLDTSIKLLQSHPESFPASAKQKGLHKCVITKQNTLYYRFNSEDIIIVTVFDNRQHPEKLKSELKKT